VIHETDQALKRLVRYEAVPPELLSGSLAELGLPVPMTTALPPPEDGASADVWTALGGELKPSLDIVVSTPMGSGRRYKAQPPAEAGVRLTPWWSTRSDPQRPSCPR
jgi:hypothetical protein